MRKYWTATALAALLIAASTLFCACEKNQPVDTPDVTTEAPITTEATVTTDAPATTEATAPDTTVASNAVSEPRDKTKEYNVLFIGNSFTYYNNMPASIFAPVARAAGYNVKVTAITKGAHYLWQFASAEDEYGKKVHDALAKTRYDIVIVQEQSNCPIANPARFYDGVRDLHAMIEENGAEMWLYATWGYGAQRKNLTQFGRDTQDMEMKLRAAYSAIAEEVGAGVAHVGAGMTYALEHTDLNLYHTDFYHPSPIGSNIAGWTLFSTIFGVSPADIDCTSTVSAECLPTVKEAAAYASSGSITVDEAYRTSSVGVTQSGTAA